MFLRAVLFFAGATSVAADLGAELAEAADDASKTAVDLAQSGKNEINQQNLDRLKDRAHAIATNMGLDSDKEQKAKDAVDGALRNNKDVQHALDEAQKGGHVASEEIQNLVNQLRNVLMDGKHLDLARDVGVELVQYVTEMEKEQGLRDDSGEPVPGADIPRDYLRKPYESKHAHAYGRGGFDERGDAQSMRGYFLLFGVFGALLFLITMKCRTGSSNRQVVTEPLMMSEHNPVQIAAGTYAAPNNP